MARTKEPRHVHFAPRGLRRSSAAAYVGVSATKFDDWVARGLMPQPKRVDGIVVWDRLEIDAAFDDLPGSDSVNPIDAVFGIPPTC